jgi:ZIP family zinc transporter
MHLLIIGIATTVATLLGGYLALRHKDRLHLILGFSAGAVIGVAFFDLIPEAIEIGSKYYETSTITSLIALGFIIYMVADRVLAHNSHSDNEPGSHGHLGPGTLTVHSYFDGLAIGIAFQVSAAVGTVVAIAVLAHKFSDGINTVNLSIVGQGDDRHAKSWLYVGALAPLVGIATTMFIDFPESFLGVTLALFAGFFLYLGASDLLPESHHRHPRIWTTVTTIIGIAVLYIAIQFAGV